MMGITCKDTVFIFRDNHSVLCNTSVTDSSLKKKLQSIAYYLTIERLGRDEWRKACVNAHENEVVLLRKLLPSRDKRKWSVRKVLNHAYVSE